MKIQIASFTLFKFGKPTEMIPLYFNFRFCYIVLILVDGLGASR